LFGHDIATLDKDALSTLRRRIGIVFQDFRLLDHMELAVARMKRSEIRGCCVAYEKPGLRCAPSGLRLLISSWRSRNPIDVQRLARRERTHGRECRLWQQAESICPQ
jgi:hypothetical protein